MTSQNELKRVRILDAAADLFATRQFHKVLLDDVARAAGVGKGTLYLYFKSKDEIYLEVLTRNFERLIQSLAREIAEIAEPEERISRIIKLLISHLYDNAIFTELMRGAIVNLPASKSWKEKRAILTGLIEDVIRDGVAKGVFSDSAPDLSAHYIPGIIRSTCILRPEGTCQKSVYEHSRTFILKALRAG